jgi:hypothetical protein
MSLRRSLRGERNPDPGMVKSKEKKTGHSVCFLARRPWCSGSLPMKSSLRLAGAAALSAALLLAACEKSAETSSTSTATATTTPDSAATTAPDAAATAVSASVGGTTVTSSSGSGTSGYIDLPIYPGSTENKDQGLSMSANGSSVAMKVYTSKDDAKTVAEWYKSHLPAAWKNGVITADNKTIGTFTTEMPDGDQSIIVATQDDKTTRIQLATKHGK